MKLPRFLHKAYALFFGYFWHPCPVCGKMFGGHEPKDWPGVSMGNNKSKMVCSLECSQKANASTHNYTVRYWGHDFSITKVQDDGHTLKMCGWGTGIKNGDYLILPNEDDTTRYRVQSIVYERNPKDMWFATVVFDPRMK